MNQKTFTGLSIAFRIQIHKHVLKQIFSIKLILLDFPKERIPNNSHCISLKHTAYTKMYLLRVSMQFTIYVSIKWITLVDVKKI